jgi:hypothetical protein
VALALALALALAANNKRSREIEAKLEVIHQKQTRSKPRLAVAVFHRAHGAGAVPSSKSKQRTAARLCMDLKWKLHASFSVSLRISKRVPMHLHALQGGPLRLEALLVPLNFLGR